MKILASAGSFLIQSGETALKLRDLQTFSIAIKFVGGRKSESYCIPQLTSIWFPVAPGITSLPVAPAPTQNSEPQPANAIQAPSDFDPDNPDLCLLFQDLLPTNTAPVYAQEQTASVLGKPYNEIIKIVGRTRSFLAVTPLNYPLTLSQREWAATARLAFDIIGNQLNASAGSVDLVGSAATTLQYRLKLQGVSGKFILGRPEGTLYPLTNFPVDSGSFALTGLDGGLAKGYKILANKLDLIVNGKDATLEKAVIVEAPLVTVALDARVPSLAIDSIVTIDEFNIQLSAHEPSEVGTPVTLVNVSNSIISIEANAPTISFDTAIDIPLLNISISTHSPIIEIVTPDPDFASVALLMHFDETNGSTSFVDDSANSLTLIANGSAATTTSQQKFGTGSLDLTSSGTNYLSYPSSSGDELDVATNQSVTIEFWAYITAVNTGSSPTSGNCMWESTGNLGERFSLHMLTISSTPTLVWATNFGGDSFSHQTALTLNSWQHIAVVRNVSTWHLYIDGVQSTTSKTGYGTIMTNSNFYIIGPRQDSVTKLYIDDFRHTTGVVRYTSGFTPPTAAFPDS